MIGIRDFVKKSLKYRVIGVVFLDLNKKNMWKIIGILFAGIFLYFALNKFDLISGVLGTVFGLLMPIIVGLCIAFIANVPLRFFESKLFGLKFWVDNKFVLKLKRPMSIVLSFLFILGIIAFVVFLVVPEFGRTVVTLTDKIPAFFAQVQEWGNGLLHQYPNVASNVSALNLDWNSIGATILGFVQTGASSVLNSTVSIATSVFSVALNLVLGFVFAIYFLYDKETLIRQMKKCTYALFSEKRSDYMVRVGGVSNKIFSNFITGQCTEAVILGTLCFIGMKIFQFPYALMISVLVGFTALIPVFGAFIGAFIGAFLILVTNPIQALWFIIYLVILQQIEGNLIYPRVVGTSVGLPALWVLFAVTVGGSAVGVVGMLVGVPLCSVIYTLFREAVNGRLAKKGTSKEKWA